MRTLRSASRRCKMAALSSTIIVLMSGTGALILCIGGGGRGNSHLASLDIILCSAKIKGKTAHILVRME